MLQEVKIKLLNLVACFLRRTTVSTVNSACWFSFGQEEEPKSLQRFKK